MQGRLLFILLLFIRGPLCGESVDRAEDYSESLANQLHALSLTVAAAGYRILSRLFPFGAGWAFGGGFVDFDNDALRVLQ